MSNLSMMIGFMKVNQLIKANIAAGVFTEDEFVVKLKDTTSSITDATEAEQVNYYLAKFPAEYTPQLLCNPTLFDRAKADWEKEVGNPNKMKAVQDLIDFIRSPEPITPQDLASWIMYIRKDI